jgi:putative ABC transport system permease protein
MLHSALARESVIAVDAMREQEYRKRESAGVEDAWTFAAYVVGGIMALGATCAAANTMYTALSKRSIEIATLRAIGFSPFSVFVSVIVESLLLALAGAFLGVLIVVLALQGVSVHAPGQLGGSAIYTQWHFSPRLMAIAVILACATSVAGGLWPALLASRLSIAAVQFTTDPEPDYIDVDIETLPYDEP